MAFFKDNQGRLDWVNAQPRQAQFTCLGDGHDGVWNIVSGIGTPEQRIEVLDWYHLMENANKVQGTPAQLDPIRALLWRGETQKAINYLRQQQCRGATGFINRRRKRHCARTSRRDRLFLTQGLASPVPSLQQFCTVWSVCVHLENAA